MIKNDILTAPAIPTQGLEASFTSVREISPADSPLNMVNQTLEDLVDNSPARLPLNAIFASESLADIQEDLGFTLSTTRTQQKKRNGSEQQTRLDEKKLSLLKRIVVEINAVSPALLDDLHQKMASAEETEDATASSQEANTHHGEQLLYCASRLTDASMSPQQASKNSENLRELMNKPGAFIALFNYIEFSSEHRLTLAEIKRIYHQALSQTLSWMQWFALLSTLKNRDKKLRTLMRILSFELVAGDHQESQQLANVIADLKRILQFFSLTAHCEMLEKRVSEHNVDADTIMKFLLSLVEKEWVSVHWLDSEVRRKVTTPDKHYTFARGIVELVKIAPEACFDKDDKRTQIIDGMLDYLSALEER